MSSSLSGGDHSDLEENAAPCCAKVPCCAKGPQRVLVVTLTTNAIFTLSQFVGAVLSNSLALYGDSLDMAIDTATYALNLWVECRRNSGQDPIRALRCELFASLVSGITLIVATIYLFYDATDRLIEEEGEEAVTEEPLYVIVFAGVNLIIDFVQIGMFAREFLKTKNEKEGMNVNLASAAAHVGADTTRTLSELVSAGLAVFGGFDPVETDAWGSFVVNGVVLVSAIGLLYTVYKKWRAPSHENASSVYHELVAPSGSNLQLGTEVIQAHQPTRLEVTA